MEMLLRLLFSAAISLAAASGAVAQESWGGKTILTKKDGIRIGKTGDNGKKIEVGELKCVDNRVLDDKDGWLQVNDGRGQNGWFRKADAVLLEDAVGYFTQRIQQNPQDDLAFFLRGIAHMLTRDFDRSIKDMEAAIRLDPIPRYLTGRGIAWLYKGEYDKSITDFTEVLRLHPKSEGAYSNRALAWAAKEHCDKAIDDFTEAIRLDPKCAAFHFNRGLQWYRKKDYDKAIADHTEATRLDPKLVVAYYSSGIAWRGKKDYDKAIAAFSEAIRLDPAYVHAFSGRADAWALKKIYGKALADGGEAIRLDPNYRDAHLGNAWIWATCSDPKHRDAMKALAAAQQALLLDSQNPYCMRTLAAAHAESGNFAEAVRWQQNALEGLKNDPEESRRLELYRDKKPYRQE